eukprot:scaffold1069_cov390-Prasinococcus_capsulatus_cf.AAC.2
MPSQIMLKCAPACISGRLSTPPEELFIVFSDIFGYHSTVDRVRTACSGESDEDRASGLGKRLPLRRATEVAPRAGTHASVAPLLLHNACSDSYTALAKGQLLLLLDHANTASRGSFVDTLPFPETKQAVVGHAEGGLGVTSDVGVEITCHCRTDPLRRQGTLPISIRQS